MLEILIGINPKILSFSLFISFNNKEQKSKEVSTDFLNSVFFYLFDLLSKDIFGFLNIYFLFGIFNLYFFL